MNTWYLKALQSLAHNLTLDVDVINAKVWCNETDCKVIEEYIRSKQSVTSEKKFYYEVGRVSEGILRLAYDIGNDALNKSFNDLLLFEEFVGLRGEDK